MFPLLFLSSEILELYDTPSVNDLNPISGYVYFAEGDAVKQITIHALDDEEEEPKDVFTVKMISASNGARVSSEAGIATLTGTYGAGICNQVMSWLHVE